MLINYKNILLSLLLIVFIACAAWLTLPDRHRKPFTPFDTIADALPDAWMEEVTATIMDKQGKPKIKIQSASVIHYAHQDTSVFTTPKLILYRPSLTPWYVTASFAKAISGTEKLHFWQHVVIHHDGDEKQPATLIETPSLTVYPDTQLAETRENIKMIQPNLIVHAIGMRASMLKGNIELLSNTRGEYAPHS